MTRDDQRAQCIEAMAKGTASHNGWEVYSPELRAARIKEMTAAFDALPAAGVRVLSDHWLIGAGAIGFETADLTNPPEPKP